MTKKPANRRKAMSGPATQVRRMLLLVPAAWKAGRKGLPLEKAVKVTGARSVKEIEDLVTSAGAFALGPSLPEDFVAVSIEEGRVVVDRALQLSTPPALSLREGAALVAALRPFENGGGKAVAASLRKLRRGVPEPYRAQASRGDAPRVLARGEGGLQGAEERASPLPGRHPGPREPLHR